MGRWPTPPLDKRHGTGLWRSRMPGTSHFFAILGCTDLRIGVSGAKFDARADFEVRLPPARPKPPENTEKLHEIFEKKIRTFFNFFFFDFFFAESIRMHPNASECVKTGPNRPENVEKLCENVEKLREGLYFLI